MLWLLVESALRCVAVPSSQAVRIAPVARIVMLPVIAVSKRSNTGALDWKGILAFAYVAIAALMLLRMIAGLALTCRLVRRAAVVSGDWAAGPLVRTVWMPTFRCRTRGGR